MGGGVDRQRQLAPLPPAQHPPQQGREAALDVDLRGAGDGLVRPVQQPLPQPLAQGVVGRPRQEGGEHRRLARALREDGACLGELTSLQAQGLHGLRSAMPWAGRPAREATTCAMALSAISAAV